MALHDHDYCAVPEKEKDDVEAVEKEKDVVDSVVESVLQSSRNATLGLSPTYSCDSGIDSFACDLDSLVQEFGNEGDDLFNFLLDGEVDLPSTEESKPSTATKLPVSRPLSAGTSIQRPGIKLKVSQISKDERSKRNAENARENRKKQKAYLLGLEKEVRQLRQERNVLIGKAYRLEKKQNELQDEVDYLKSVLANDSVLASLIERVSETPGVSLSTSFCSFRKTTPQPEENSEKACESGGRNMVCTRSSRKRACSSQKSVSRNPGDKRRRVNSAGGVCLHVKDNRVSLEFCRICSKKAED